MKSILTLTGPTCSGKSTLERMMKERYGYENVISTTTRPMRDGEVNGVNYHYVTIEEFDALVAGNKMVEHVEFNGNKYGVSVDEVERVFATGKPVIVVVEPEGRKQVEQYAREHGWVFTSVFVGAIPKVIADRFFRRYNAELAACDPNDLGKLMLTYSSRLGTMMTTEVSWQIQSFTGAVKYDIRVLNFDSETEEDVMSAVQDMVERNCNLKEVVTGAMAGA